MKALIIGGGIAGATAALCLHNAGVDVELFEKNSALAEVGAGLQLSPNGMKVLEQLGLADSIAHNGFEPEALEMRWGESGTSIFSIPIKSFARQKYKAPYLHIHRADLLDLLLRELNHRMPTAVKLGKDLLAITQDKHGVTAQFGDGTSATADVLIGADGIHSTVRRLLQGDQPARFTGNVAWRMVVPVTPKLQSVVPPNASIWVGQDRHAVSYYLRQGTLINFVGVVEKSDWQKEGWAEPGSVAQLASDFQSWAKPVTAIIDEATACFRWALFDRNPLEQWSSERVTLMGDACHPMLPFLAQGAVMAIEDAWVLARSLAQSPTPTAALQNYEAHRKPRTSRVQLAARRQMGIYHRHNRINQVAAYGPMWLAARVLPDTINAMQDWIYAFDPTEALTPKQS